MVSITAENKSISPIFHSDLRKGAKKQKTAFTYALFPIFTPLSLWGLPRDFWENIGVGPTNSVGFSGV